MAVRTVNNADDRVIELFKQSDAPVMTAKEIADKLDMTRQGANYRLKQLRKEGVVERKDIGSRAVAWWLLRS